MWPIPCNCYLANSVARIACASIFFLVASAITYAQAEKHNQKSQAAKPASTNTPTSSSTASKQNHSATNLIHTLSAPLFPLDEIAKPATVYLDGDTLTVNADNSDLSQILFTLSRISGMRTLGLKISMRIYGRYGPGNARDVLLELLRGSEYNFILLGGSASGLPRELQLSIRRATDTASPASVSLSQPDTEQIEPRPNNLIRDTTDIGPAAPGLIPPAPSQNDQEDDIRIQRNLQRLQQRQETQDSPPN